MMKLYDNVYVKGLGYGSIACTCEGLYGIARNNSRAVTLVPENVIEHDCRGIAIGSYVLNGTHKYVVTSYEHDTNMLICRSASAKQDISHTRSAFKPHEVRMVTEEQLKMALVNSKGEVVEYV